jgi:antitoxin component of MazEF toxin-antitoxin module
MTVLVKKIGGSMAVVIPKGIANEMEISEGTSLEISASAGSIVMRKRGSRPRRPLSEIVAQIDPAAYRKLRREFPDHGPVGKEYW